MKKKQSNHGGRRECAGRKPAEGKGVIRFQVCLSPSSFAEFEASRGDRTRGEEIERLMGAANKPDAPQTGKTEKVEKVLKKC